MWPRGASEQRPLRGGLYRDGPATTRRTILGRGMTHRVFRMPAPELTPGPMVFGDQGAVLRCGNALNSLPGTRASGWSSTLSVA